MQSWDGNCDSRDCARTCSMARQHLGTETPTVEQVSGLRAPSMPGLEQMTREGRKEGGPPPCPQPATLPDIIASGNLLTQACCEPPPSHPPPQPQHHQGFPYSARRVKREVSQGPGTQPSGVASEATRGQSSVDVSPGQPELPSGRG